MKLKISILLVVTFLLSGCVDRYNQPQPSKNNALLIIDQGVPFEFAAPFGMIVNVELDGKLIDTFKYPEMKVYVKPGTYTLSIDINAYYYNRAKYKTTKEYEIEFKPNQKYVVTAMPETKRLTDNKSDVTSNYSIISDDLKITDSIVLEDSALRSFVCKGEECTRQISNAVLGTVVPIVIQ